MDIVLKPFNNSNLPIITLPGFVDLFDRPQATHLGHTDDGKAWSTLDPGSTTSVWGTTGAGTARMLDASSQHHLAVVDGLTPGGTLTAVLSSFDGGAPSRRFGLVMGVEDADTFVAIAPVSTSDHRLRIAQRIDGTMNMVGGSGPELQAGDKLSVTLAGLEVSVRINGEVVLASRLVSEVEGTRHGFYAFAGAVAEWDYIELVP